MWHYLWTNTLKLEEILATKFWNKQFCETVLYNAYQNQSNLDV